MAFLPHLRRKDWRRIISNLSFFESIGLVKECYDSERDDWILVMKYIGDVYTDGEGHFYELRGNVCIRRKDLEETYRKQMELLERMARRETTKKIMWNDIEMGRWI